MTLAPIVWKIVRSKPVAWQCSECNICPLQVQTGSIQLTVPVSQAAVQQVQQVQQVHQVQPAAAAAVATSTQQPAVAATSVQRVQTAVPVNNQQQPVVTAQQLQASYLSLRHVHM